MKKTNQKRIFLSIVILMTFLVFPRTTLASEISSQNVIKLVNESRKENKLKSLIKNDTLEKIARDKAEDMLKSDYFAHTSPQGISPWYWFEKEGYDYKYAGENLAINFKTAEAQHKAWMESPTHKKNILNSHYLEIGVAVVKGKINDQETTLVVQEFGMQSSAFDDPSASKEFNVNEKKNKILNKEVKIEPQVLSSKNVTNETLKGINPFENKEKGFFQKLVDGMANNKLPIYNTLVSLSFILMAISILLTPMIVLTVSVGKVWDAFEEKRRSEVFGNLNEVQKEYFKLVKELGKTRKIFEYSD